MEYQICTSCKQRKEANSKFFSFRKDQNKLNKKCKECIKKTRKQYYINNKDSILKNKKEYYQNNRNSIINSKKDYYENNKENINEYQKEYRKKKQRKAFRK